MSDTINLVRVVRVGGVSRVIAAAPIPAGARVLRLEGVLTDRPSRYSVQVGRHRHLDLGAGLTPGEMRARRPAAFMNHSCAPSAKVRGRDVVTLCALAAGDELTFDYDTTEYELAAPFACQCGSARCVGEVRGFRHLSEQDRQRLRPFAMRYLWQQLTHDHGAAPRRPDPGRRPRRPRGTECP